YSSRLHQIPLKSVIRAQRQKRGLENHLARPRADAWRYDGLCPTFNATVRLHHLPERFPAVSGPASYCKNDSPLVRRLGGRLDRLRPLLPVAAPAGIPLLSLDYPLFASQDADAPAHRLAGRKPVHAAGDPQCVLEAIGRRRSDPAYSGPAWRHNRAALLPAFHHRPTDSGLVRAGTAPGGRDCVPPLRALESRLHARAAEL